MIRGTAFPTVLLAGALVAGCALVDQRSFDRSAGRAPVPPPAPAPQLTGPPPVPPLFVVDAGSPPSRWQPGLRRAVGEALARKRNALFTVSSLVPLAASPDQQSASLQSAATTQGLPVADAIVSAGATPGQVEMQAASDPSLRRPEVRVSVR